MERKGVPLVDIMLHHWRAELNQIPLYEPGLSSLVADTSCGKEAQTKTAQQFSDALDGLGGTIRTRADHQATLVESEFLRRTRCPGSRLLPTPCSIPSSTAPEVTKLLAQRSRRYQGA